MSASRRSPPSADSDKPSKAAEDTAGVQRRLQQAQDQKDEKEQQKKPKQKNQGKGQQKDSAAGKASGSCQFQAFLASSAYP